MSRAAGSLVVTLRRGLAGKRATEVSAAHALRLRRPGQSAEHPNNESVRGQINKARLRSLLPCPRASPNARTAHHPQLRDLVSVELKSAYDARMAAEAARAAPRPPLVVEHPPRASA